MNFVCVSVNKNACIVDKLLFACYSIPTVAITLQKIKEGYMIRAILLAVSLTCNVWLYGALKHVAHVAQAQACTKTHTLPFEGGQS